MEQDPNNAEVNADLKTARLQVEKAGGYKGFKKITIVEEEDEESPGPGAGGPGGLYGDAKDVNPCAGEEDQRLIGDEELDEEG